MMKRNIFGVPLFAMISILVVSFMSGGWGGNSGIDTASNNTDGGGKLLS